MADKLVCLWVYDDGEDSPFVLRNPPDNLKALLTEWNALDDLFVRDQAQGEEAGWQPINTWLAAKGVEVIEPEELRLDDFREDNSPAALAKLAEEEGWGLLALQEQFGIGTDRLRVKTLEGVIAQAIEEGDDADWIRQLLEGDDA